MDCVLLWYSALAASTMSPAHVSIDSTTLSCCVCSVKPAFCFSLSSLIYTSSHPHDYYTAPFPFPSVVLVLSLSLADLWCCSYVAVCIPLAKYKRCLYLFPPAVVAIITHILAHALK